MKRRRQVLQISTFPFLAVLLCTMGALILLLLIIDRCARIVAMARIQHKMEQETAEEERVVQAKKAELEQRQQALHAALANEDNKVLDKVKGAQGKLDSLAAGIKEEKDRTSSLQDKQKEEQSRLDQGEKDLIARRDAIREAIAADKRQTEASRAELARMSADLRQLENSLADLQSLRKRDQHTFSLVPYRGKRGDNRRPIYIECARDQIIFHPDHLVVDRRFGRSEQVVAEVKQRSEKAKAQTTSAPYILLLVRPDGIRTYYETLGALRDLDFDFGYEFVDAGWILDFPEGDNIDGKQPWMVNAKAPGWQFDDTAAAAETPEPGTPTSAGLRGGDKAR